MVELQLKVPLSSTRACAPLPHATSGSSTLLPSLPQVNESLRSAVAYNQQLISPGANFMLINGLAFDINAFDLYGELGQEGGCLPFEINVFHQDGGRSSKGGTDATPLHPLHILSPPPPPPAQPSWTACVKRPGSSVHSPQCWACLPRRCSSCWPCARTQQVCVCFEGGQQG